MVLLLLKTLLIVFIHILPVNGKEIDSLIAGIVEPGKMVDAQHIYMDIPPINGTAAQFPGGDGCQHFLGAKYLMAAAEGLDPGKDPV